MENAVQKKGGRGMFLGVVVVKSTRQGSRGQGGT